MAFRLSIIYTGGTIGSTAREPGGPLSPLAGEAFRDAFAELVAPLIADRIAGVEIAFRWLAPSLDSTNLQPADWVRIAGQIIGRPGDRSPLGQHDGFLVLHGTDTMAASAAACSLLLTGIDAGGGIFARASRPVVFTGSQRPLFWRDPQTGALALNEGSDAAANVVGAAIAARAGPAGVSIHFAGRLLQGNRAVKVHTCDDAAFATPNAEPLADMAELAKLAETAETAGQADPAGGDSTPPDGAALARLQRQLAHAGETIGAADVLTFTAFPAAFDAAAGTSALAAMLEGALSACGDRLGALYLQGYGAGNIPSGNPDDDRRGAVFRVLKRAHERGVVIVAGTQVAAGAVDTQAYAAGSWLAAAGAVAAGDMVAPCVQAKLAVLLALADFEGRGWGRAEIERLMRTPLAGEITAPG